LNLLIFPWESWIFEPKNVGKTKLDTNLKKRFSTESLVIPRFSVFLPLYCEKKLKKFFGGSPTEKSPKKSKSRSGGFTKLRSVYLRLALRMG
jgi:hypothetical protein